MARWLRSQLRSEGRFKPSRGWLARRLRRLDRVVANGRNRPIAVIQENYLLDSEFHRDHDRRQPIEDRSWTSGIGCEALVSANTRPCSAKMKSTLKFCLH